MANRAPTLLFSGRSRRTAAGTRQPALVRPAAKALPGLQLTPRDVRIVYAVATHRALTAIQIHALFFAPSRRTHLQVSSRCHYRLKLLFQHGYLFRDTPPAKYTEGRKPLVYFLDRGALRLLTSHCQLTPEEIAWRPSHNQVTWPFLDHLLATNDVRVAVTLAARAHGYTVRCWRDERQMMSRQMKDYVLLTGNGGARRVAVVPDGYIHISGQGYHYHHFLEVDRGTETVGQGGRDQRKSFARKIQAYQTYYRSGQYAQRYGTQALRVLVVTTSQARLQNLRAVTQRVGGGRQFWFTTLARVQATSVLTQPIWQMAGARGRHALVWPAAQSRASAGQATLPYMGANGRPAPMTAG